MRIKEAREMRGLTQQSVAEHLGIGRVSYARYETGARKPNPQTLALLADLFNVSADYLLGKDDAAQGGADGNVFVLSAREKALVLGLRSAAPVIRDAVFSMASAVLAPSPSSSKEPR